MNLRGQSGMTMIELVLAMTVTALVMVSLGGVVFGANLVSSTWGQRTYLAQAAQLVPGPLQADAHRYVPCPGPATGSELHLCLPGGPEMVSYTAPAGCPCDLVRTDVQLGTQSIVVRGLEAAPSFATTCATGARVDSGSIAVTLRYRGDAAPQPAMRIYFTAPAGSC